MISMSDEFHAFAVSFVHQREPCYICPVRVGYTVIISPNDDDVDGDGNDECGKVHLDEWCRFGVSFSLMGIRRHRGMK